MREVRCQPEPKALMYPALLWLLQQKAQLQPPSALLPCLQLPQQGGG